MEPGHTLLRLVAAGQTHPGQRRPLNEDAWLIASESETARFWAQRGRLFVVADGMGGYAAGEVASRLTIDTVQDEYYDGSDDSLSPATRLQEAIQAANYKVYEQSATEASQSGMGTTIVAAVVHDEWITIANVGDSRAYLVRAGEAIKITRDHSWVAEQVIAGMLTEEEARNHIYRNVVTRCLGHRPAVVVDTFEELLESGDVVLLCSDGLSNQVSDDEIARYLTDYLPDEAADQLVTLANQRGGPDNITVVILKLFPQGSEQEPSEPGEGDAPGTRAEPVVPERAADAAGVAASGVKSGAVRESKPSVREGVSWSRVGLVTLLAAVAIVLCLVSLLAVTLAWEPIRDWLVPQTPMPTTFAVPPLTFTSTHTATPTSTALHTPEVTSVLTATSTGVPATATTSTPTPTSLPEPDQ